ncbi:MAG: chemotaxis protein CheW [Desulfarculus sp.]|nr:chemotaxis protein CheW [Desulfarculus sp.]
MSQPAPVETSWVIFRLQGQFFGLPVDETYEMLVVPEVTALPQAPDYVRGMINLRGQVMPLVDLRSRLGMATSRSDKDSLVQMLEQREQDHKNWLAELEASVRERRSFRLTTDPHQCAFGKWYDAFQTDDLRLSGHLLKFDAPHQRVHQVGKEVIDLMARKEHEAALALIDRTRDTTLGKLVTLFGEVREIVRKSQTEIALVTQRQGRLLAVTVDAVDAVEELQAGTVEEMQGGLAGLAANLVCRIGRRQEGGAMVLLLDLGRLFEETQKL